MVAVHYEIIVRLYVLRNFSNASVIYAKGSSRASPVGFRLGKSFTITRRTINMGFNFEIGDRPGVKGKGYYFGCGMSLAFVK